MKKCTTFQGLLKPLSEKLVADAVKRFDTDRYSKGFKTRDHLMAMIYAQLNQIKSLRELEIAFNSQQSLRRLLGIKKLHRSTLSDANHRRAASCFLWIADHLMSVLPRKRRKEIGKVVRLMDSSPIQLKGLGYEWSKANRTFRHQGLKLHVEYDLQMAMPVRIKTSYPNYNDCLMGQKWPITTNSIYVFDKGYCDYNWWWKINQEKAYFVTRLREKSAIEVVERNEPKSELILEDTLIKLTNKYPQGTKKNLYIEKLRRIVVKREDNKKSLVIVTNLLNASAESISDLYKARWQIELFFKWIKQHLRVKEYLGRSENAVKVQLATAIITYILIGLFKRLFKNNETLQKTLVWVKHNLSEKGKYERPPPIYHVGTERFMVNMAGVYL